MALGRRKKERQQDFWIATEDLPRSEGHIFYRKLNELLREADFDSVVESLCKEHYHDSMGRPGIPPGTYFRMLLVGYVVDPEKPTPGRRAVSISRVRADFGGVMPLPRCEFVGDRCAIGCWRAVTANKSAQKQARAAACAGSNRRRPRWR